MIIQFLVHRNSFFFFNPAFYEYNYLKFALNLGFSNKTGKQQDISVKSQLQTDTLSSCTLCNTYKYQTKNICRQDVENIDKYNKKCQIIPKRREQIKNPWRKTHTPSLESDKTCMLTHLKHQQANTFTHTHNHYLLSHIHYQGVLKNLMF